MNLNHWAFYKRNQDKLIKEHTIAFFSLPNLLCLQCPNWITEDRGKQKLKGHSDCLWSLRILVIKSSDSGVTPAGSQSHSNISCTTSGNLISLSVNHLPGLLKRSNEEMYDKLHAELALGNQQLLLFIIFIIFIIVIIIQKVLHLVYYRQMHTQKFIQFFQEKFLSQSISKIFLIY